MPASAVHGAVQWSMWTTTVRVVTADADAAPDAGRAVAQMLGEVDQAASRFRPDSELSRLCAVAGSGPWAVSDMLWSLLTTATRAAAATDGLVDPTVACALNDLGYDRTIAEVTARSGSPFPVQVRRPIGWQRIRLDERTRAVELPAGCHLDLGATAKAWAADRAAEIASRRTGTGVLVSIGGDIAVAGRAPEPGWMVAIADDHACARPDDPTVVLRSGGLATSSTTTRSWQRGQQRLHHIIDPRTARPAVEHWRTVSVAAATCVDANVAATAAVIRGVGAVDWLAGQELPARLVARSGAVTHVARWPVAAA